MIECGALVGTMVMIECGALVGMMASHADLGLSNRVALYVGQTTPTRTESPADL